MERINPQTTSRGLSMSGASIPSGPVIGDFFKKKFIGVGPWRLVFSNFQFALTRVAGTKTSVSPKANQPQTFIPLFNLIALLLFKGFDMDLFYLFFNK